MKWQNLAIFGLLLASASYCGCAHRYQKSLQHEQPYAQKAIIAFTNPDSAEHEVFVGHKTNAGTTDMILIRPGETELFYPDRRDLITFVVKWWEENGWQDDEYKIGVEKPGRLSDTVSVILDDNFLRDIVLQMGIVVNSTPWPVYAWDDRGNQYGLLYPSQYSEITAVAPGQINFLYQREDGFKKTYRFTLYIDREKKDQDWQGRRIDWVAHLYATR